MKFSALTSSLPCSTAEAIVAIAELGFACVDTPPIAEPQTLRLLESNNLQVTCVGLEKEQPDFVDIGCADDEQRRRSVAYYNAAIETTSKLGAPLAYLTPPTATDAETMSRWTDSLLVMGDCARQCGVRIGVEHFPRRALPTVRETLAYLESLGHDSLALLIDVGHCLISGEDPAAAIGAAGHWLGYIHFDDNDGDQDLHWPLLSGVLREEQLREVLEAQATAGYQGGLCLELNPALEHPVKNLEQGLQLLRRLSAS